jgi:hypothetical protein
MNNTLTTQQKALALNLDASKYGSFAEIGAGQEVARWFFKAGGAAGTVAKTISAYDMAVSDAIYGKAQRYVSRERLHAMLEHEFAQVSDQLREKFGDKRAFFSFANTIATRRYHSGEHGRGWIGIRFQTAPHAEPSQITMHAHLLDTLADREQQAIGILGVNLIYGASFLRDKPLDLITGLMDELSRERVEIDMIKFTGPAFAGVDNRLMSLQLVEQGFTEAAMFTADGEVVQPSEVLYKKPILVERGHFRPLTNVTLDILERARDAFLKEPGVNGAEPVIIAEMTLRNLLHVPEQPDLAHKDFLARADILGALGFDVLISRFELDYEVAEYLAGYTDNLIGFAIGLPTLKQFLEERYYSDLSGGILEAAGRFYKRSVKAYVYPAMDAATGRIETFDEIIMPGPWEHLHQLLRELGRAQGIKPSNQAWLLIGTENVLSLIESGDPKWESMVPPKVAECIKREDLFRVGATAKR